jgi:hypothetical protein
MLYRLRFDVGSLGKVGLVTEGNRSEGGNDPTDIHLSACQESDMPQGHHADDGAQATRCALWPKRVQTVSRPMTAGSLLFA